MLRAAGALSLGLELERGRWQGRPADTASLDAMASDVGVALLLRAARRLPDPALRVQAERLVVRQRIAASPFPEVRAAAEAVEAAVLQRGVNPISLADHPPERVSLETLDLARASVASEGGPGGQGGHGGRGGRGGQGGSGTTCTDSDGRTWSLSGGTSGGSGSDGSDGLGGRNGATGQPGAVRFEAPAPPRS